MHGLDTEKLDAVQRIELELACLRRKQWEARLQAIEIVGVLGKAMGGRKGGQAKRVSASAMLSMMGESLE